MSHDQTPKGAPDCLVQQGWTRAGISRAQAYRLMRAGRFPKPVKLGRASRFLLSEIDAWIAARVAERDAAAQPVREPAK